MASRVANLTVLCYAIEDAFGEIHAAACIDEYDVLYLEPTDADGRTLYFESEAHHLEEWAREHGLEYLYSEEEIEFILE